MTLFDTIISGVILSLLSGLAWLAYKHPHAYKKMIPTLPALIMGLFACVMAYDMGVIKVFGPATSIPLTGFIFLGIYFYLMFLYYLPDLLKKDKNDHPKDK
jgi:hypothetical protein